MLLAFVTDRFVGLLLSAACVADLVVRGLLFDGLESGRLSSSPLVGGFAIFLYVYMVFRMRLSVIERR
jgi:hypothetical protein